MILSIHGPRLSASPLESNYDAEAPSESNKMVPWSRLMDC